ncbi:MAG TPA: hypothetical protein VK186_00280 [Candidatus Deferrimicrobium sp.]|nr:hypothetical protein [Candidatus Deferrimicrobium sp.]
MSDELEIKTMVEALTENIGVKLGGSIRLSFFKLAERLMKSEEFINMEKSIQQLTLDLLALSIFYNEIISPLQGGQSFITIAKKSNASTIRIGKDKLDQSFSEKARKCVNHFTYILDKNSIPISLLSFSSLHNFVDNIKNTLNKQNESMD